MNSEKIKKIIKLTHEIVKDEKEPFKVAAFKIILQYLLQCDISSENNAGSMKSVVPVTKEKVVNGLSDIDYENKMKKLAVNCEITLEELKDTISIKKGEIHLLSPIKGNDVKKQVIVSQCVLLGFDELLGQEWVKSKVLKECLRNSGIQDKSGHLAENLKKQESIFRLRGSNLGTEYKLTSSGKIETYKLIKQLSTGE